MTQAAALALVLMWVAVGSAHAQVPTGAIAGVVTDASGAAVAAARISITNRETGQIRTATTETKGWYGVEALPPGAYQVLTEVTGFRRLERLATVEAGSTTTVNLTLEVGEVTATVMVGAATPLIRTDHHQVGGVVTRTQIEQLPLNGRNFLELAKLEPGVTNPVRLNDGRMFVSPLGSGLQTIPRVGYTRMTVDGASITTPTTIGTLLQVSQDVVQEFQLSTANFDAATSLTSNGAINIVTRSGGNTYHGSGFALYRGDELSAYPALRRDPANPDPSFERHQFGFALGGPLRKERAFLFGSYERTDQQGVVSVQPRTPEFAHLGGIFPSPYLGNLLSVRGDVRITPSHNAFARYTYDGSYAFEGSPNLLPSGWARRTKQATQGVAGLTSVLSPRVVNDFRFSYLVVDAPLTAATQEDCGDCLGLGAPRILIPDAGLSLGESNQVTSVGERYQVTNNLTWQRGQHRLQVGFDWEHASSTASVISREPAQLTLWAPDRVRQLNPGIVVPASFHSLDDILRLPLRSFETAVGPGTVLQRDFRAERILDLYRVYAGDTWRVAPRLTMNMGLSWSYEPNALNYDLSKPDLLIPILGSEGLNPPAVQTHNFSPALGVVWMATRDGKTTIRGGAGRYFDPLGSAHPINLEAERVALSPLGTGRLTQSGRNILHDDRPLDFPQPTAFTGAQLLPLLPGIRGALVQSINPDNRDFSVRNIDLTKEGQNLSDPHNATPYAIHASVGLQRELAPNFVVSADIVWKRFVHTFINGIDYNRWDSASGPVIRACTPTERGDVRAVCSNGNMFFDTTIGRAQYKGLLVRLEKRFTRRAQFLVSYALASYVGSNGTGTGTSEASGGRVFGFNNDNWFENYGPLPTDQRHVLNLSGFVEFPWHIRVAATVSAYSRPPFTAYIAGADFNGDGTENDLLPGTKVNQFGRGLDRKDLERLLEQYNQEYGANLTLPAEYSFDDDFFTHDVRLSRDFVLGGGSARLSVFADVFNLFNVANLVGYSGNLTNAATFGQPTARFTQVFGSGGPRAFQLGARVVF